MAVARRKMFPLPPSRFPLPASPFPLPALRRACIDSLEVLEDRSTLIRAQASQFIPRRLAEFERRFAVRARILRTQLVAALRRRGLALVGVLALFLLQRTSGIEQ